MNDRELPDALLTVRCQLGDQEAWESLVHRWHPRLWRFISRMLSDRSTAEDVLQTVWLRVVRSFSRLRDPERLGAWLYRIARLAVADRLREHYRRPPADELGDVVDHDGGIEQLHIQETVDTALGILHASDREAVVLYYLEEFSTADVAEICGVPIGTVKSRLHRARRIIRDTFNSGKTA